MSIFYDFHIHSCLSPCAEEDMTPYNLVNLSALMGMQAIALTDHNSCQNCGAAMRAGEEAGITVIPGMELCTSEEIQLGVDEHLLLSFDVCGDRLILGLLHAGRTNCPPARGSNSSLDSLAKLLEEKRKK